MNKIHKCTEFESGGILSGFWCKDHVSSEAFLSATKNEFGDDYKIDVSKIRYIYQRNIPVPCEPGQMILKEVKNPGSGAYKVTWLDADFIERAIAS